jgi:hypothetical protein
MLGVSRLLVMAKEIAILHPIAICEMFIRLISCSIVLQLQGLFQEHLSPHEFEVSTPRDYETIIFNIKALLDLHLDWVVMQVDVENAFNNVSQTVIIKKLWDVKSPLANIISFTKLFCGVQFSLYYQHKQHKKRVTIIESFSSTRQGAPLGGFLFALIHY